MYQQPFEYARSGPQAGMRVMFGKHSNVGQKPETVMMLFDFAVVQFAAAMPHGLQAKQMLNRWEHALLLSRSYTRSFCLSVRGLH